MLLHDKVAAVESLFQKLDTEIRQFQSQTGMHCANGCGKCCFKPDIEATILEFLPFALHLYQQGKAEVWHERLKGTDSSICMILNPTQEGAGLCSDYLYRGLICRLFGYSARTNKYNKKELVTCAIIKTEQVGAVQQAEALINRGDEIPVMSNFYMQLHGIDAELSREFYPINEAIRKALEVVMNQLAYTDAE